MSEINNFSCEQAREELDFLLEARVEARISKALGEKSETAAALSEPSAALKHHLTDCHHCHNYQLANRVIIEAAKDLPKLTADQALTDSIMAMIDQEMDAENVPPKFVKTRTSFALMALSFAAFTLVISGLSAEGLWSAFSWLVALAVVALLRPLIEYNPYPNSTRMVKAQA